MLILGLNKTTLLDYPGHVAATIFTGGCNFRCPFCHNAGLVLAPSTEQAISKQEIFSFLRKRKNILQGVCITGGEPTLQPDLKEFIQEIKALGYLVKLDTNGYEPEKLKALLELGLLDYVAMDIKNSPQKYEAAVGQKDVEISRINTSIELLRVSGIDHEFRTTVVKELHSREDILAIAEWIAGCPHYYLQRYQENEGVIRNVLEDDAAEHFHAWSAEEMKELAKLAGTVPGMTGEVKVRGID